MNELPPARRYECRFILSCGMLYHCMVSTSRGTDAVEEFIINHFGRENIEFPAKLIFSGIAVFDPKEGYGPCGFNIDDKFTRKDVEKKLILF